MERKAEEAEVEVLGKCGGTGRKREADKERGKKGETGSTRTFRKPDSGKRRERCIQKEEAMGLRKGHKFFSLCPAIPEARDPS